MTSQQHHEELKIITLKYNDVTEKINEINKSLKELRSSKKESEEYILEFMKKNDLVNLEVHGHRFTLKEIVKTKSFSKKTLVDNLLMFMDQHQVNNITQKLFDDSDSTIAHAIKHKKL